MALPDRIRRRRCPPAGRGLRMVAALGALVLASGLSLSCTDRSTGRRLPDGSRLVQKGDFQALYGPDGRLRRILNDANGDGVAEAIVFYRPDGKPERSELDTDGDRLLDRWETLRPDGTVSVSASSRAGNGRPDSWEYASDDGFVYQVDYDDDGDGQVDRTEYAER